MTTSSIMQILDYYAQWIRFKPQNFHKFRLIVLGFIYFPMNPHSANNLGMNELWSNTWFVVSNDSVQFFNDSYYHVGILSTETWIPNLVHVQKEQVK